MGGFCGVVRRINFFPHPFGLNARSRTPSPIPFQSPFGLSLSKPHPVRPEVSKDRAEPVEAFCLIRPPRSLPSPDAALSPRRATHFLLLRQEKVSKEKATLLSASLRCAAGNLRCSVQPGSSSNSRRSNNRSTCSVWPSAPRRRQKGLRDGFGFGIRPV